MFIWILFLFQLTIFIPFCVAQLFEDLRRQVFPEDFKNKYATEVRSSIGLNVYCLLYELSKHFCYVKL